MQFEFSGIQSFIFGDVTFSSTKQEIKKRSEFIIRATDTMDRWLNSRFSKADKYRVLSKSSGKLICALSHRTSICRITELADLLQKTIYSSTEGMLEMFYGVCEAKVVLEKEADIKSNVMTELANATIRNKYHCSNTLGIVLDEWKDSSFTPKGLDERFDDLEKNEQIMAAIKMDLDNLGSFFKGIISFDIRKKASECLSSVLNNALNNTEGVYPIFVGGDDIFVLAPVDRYLGIVSLIQENIKKELMSHDDLSLYRDVYGISGGVSFIRNDLGAVPLIYYFEQSETELEKAKKVSGKNVLSINNCILTWNQIKTIWTVVLKNRAIIFKGIDDQQQLTLFFNIKELVARIVRLHRNMGNKMMTAEEEKDVYNIH